MYKSLFFQIYDKLRKEYPDFIEKIVIVEGDIGMLNLGISEEDRTKLTQEVSTYFFLFISFLHISTTIYDLRLIFWN